MVLLLVSESTVVSSSEEGGRIPLGSQASESNVPKASHGCASGEENVLSNCLMCKTKPHAVRLKVRTPGHCIFSSLLLYFDYPLILTVELMLASRCYRLAVTTPSASAASMV